jgi:hypothetical protein
MASDDPKMSKQGTVGKIKHVTSTFPQTLEIVKKWQELKRGYGFIQHGIIDYHIKKTERPRHQVKVSRAISSGRHWKSLY